MKNYTNVKSQFFKGVSLTYGSETIISAMVINRTQHYQHHGHYQDTTLSAFWTLSRHNIISTMDIIRIQHYYGRDGKGFSFKLMTKLEHITNRYLVMHYNSQMGGVSSVIHSHTYLLWNSYDGSFIEGHERYVKCKFFSYCDLQY